MKLLSILLKVLTVVLLFVIVMPYTMFAQATEGTAIQIPEGFNWIYIGFFIVGMVIHYLVKIFHTFGSANILKNCINNFFGWFFNKFHWTLIASGAAAIMGVASAYQLSIHFATINTLGIVVALVAGYLGDSAFNNGVLKSE
jgi:hypothetical protein